MKWQKLFFENGTSPLMQGLQRCWRSTLWTHPRVCGLGCMRTMLFEFSVLHFSLTDKSLLEFLTLITLLQRVIEQLVGIFTDKTIYLY